MISYQHLQESIDCFSKHGFKRIETPWLVTDAIDSITRPKNKTAFTVEVKKKNLVASGEQGFLYLYLKNQLPKGRFQTTTPCFRDDVFDLTHTKYFIKNELIITDSVNKTELKKIVELSKTFFDTFFDKKTTIEKTKEGYDITIKGDELGSYGIRKVEFLTWIYGTACAEPRLSILINKHNK